MTAREETTARRFRLALFVAVTCNLAWLFVHLFMAAFHSRRASLVFAIPFCLAVGSLLKWTSKFFVKRDWLSALFWLAASSTACGFLMLPFILALPRGLAENLSAGLAMLLMSVHRRRESPRGLAPICRRSTWKTKSSGARQAPRRSIPHSGRMLLPGCARQHCARLTTMRKAKIHWYEAHGISKKKFKIKRFLD